MKYINSPTTQIKFDEQEIYLKRDDLLDKDFSGNKARKFYYYLVNNFEGITKVIGYGSPQANSLHTFSVLAKLKNWQLDFYVDHIASYVKDNPDGNYKSALANGANIISLEDIDTNKKTLDYIKEDVLPNESSAAFVPEGGRCQEAEFGVAILASEIKTWAKENLLNDLKIVLPSGTGTTALFLQKNLPEFEVLTCACVGGDDYLKKQFFELSEDEKNHPTIFNTGKKYHFGKLYKEFYEMYNELYKTTEIEFELLYDPLAWINLREYLKNNILDKDTKVLYIHQGGLLGNISMLKRYQRKF
jgi:1-aminocyclopropane-1-carboxylate deaminase/D-cysteine desulfhydrase-like pyridoxal-dependent ACC family enzyme